MTKEQLLAAIAAPGLYVVGARRELIVIETDADGVQHELKPASLRRDGVLAPDGWSDREDLIVVGPFGRLVPEPIDMVLHCPKCGEQHIDAPEPARYATASNTESVRKGFEMGGYELNPNRWDNPPHRSHLCQGCGHIWRPADVPTNGVAAVKTKGKHDDEPLLPKRLQRLVEVGATMIGLTTTVRGIDEWPMIPALWERCMQERDAALVSLRQAQGLLNEVRENFTRDDDLPNGLLSRIDDAIGEQT